jgi:hypothetical protein
MMLLSGSENAETQATAVVGGLDSYSSVLVNYYN